jgi:hypothetical protein
MDDAARDFVDTFSRFMRDVINQAELSGSQTLSPLGAEVQEFFDAAPGTDPGADIRLLPIVTQLLPGHRMVDADLALAAIAARGDSRTIGVSGGQQRDHSSLAELLSHPFSRFASAAVDYMSMPSGAGKTHRVVSFGLHLLAFEGAPLAVLQRGAAPDRGRAAASVEVLATSPDSASAFLAELDRLMVSLSVLRGQVLSFTATEFGHGAAGATFLERPEVDAADVVLPPGVLDRIVRHVVGIGEHREHLLAAGQHLKRGVLLYGPPGTGKTLTVRHLLSRTPGTTAVLLTGAGIRFVSEAADLARAMQPAIVVLEDVDLVASERGMHGAPQPLLFAMLDALDGLDGDADVTFILTTNRVDVLERALTERPGRVDLAVEIPLPDRDSRRRLFARYAQGLPLSGPALDAAAEAAEGTTGSFAKELIRRAVLMATDSGRTVTDGDLEAALRDLLAASESLTRNLLGSAPRDVPPPAATYIGFAD